MDNLNFKVSAELKNILGKDLITSPNIAILELVKNSYDAHATKVEITFDEDKLIIADNGKGMSLDDLINKWLFVAYSAKSDGTEDLSYRSKIKRHYAGAKGIGRMSCDRLAKFLTLTTRSIETQSTEILHVDWSAFDDNAKLQFASINIPHETSTEIPSFPEDKPNGTILEFSGLHSDWQLDAIKSLRQSLAKMINPFAEADNFKIEIIAPAFADNDKNLQKEFEALSADWDNLDDRRRGAITAKKLDIINGPIENSIADVLKLKTTQIESRIVDGIIKTILYDRGVKMYEIEEQCPYGKLSDASVSLLYLNRAAKYSFSVSMGVTPVKYGNVFLFRNGIRIWPYGEWDDDSWGLNQRAQQGYNRFLGTRDLFGRVNVETDSITDFKEVSSRDGGLIETAATLQLKDYFRQIHSRLERYVVGVLWGEGFIRRDYFINIQDAQRVRNALQNQDKDSETPEFIYQNIGSRVDFLQLIKSLVNDSKVDVLFYNQELANIVNKASEAEILQTQLIDDLRKVAQKTNDESLVAKVDDFERQLQEAKIKAEKAEREAEEARIAAEKERKEKEAAEAKAREEEAKRKQREKELELQQQKNSYLVATRNTTQEVQDITHAISLASTELLSLISNLSIGVSSGMSTEDALNKIHEAGFFANKVKQLSMLIIKADIVSLKNKVRVDVKEYIREYVLNFKDTLNISLQSDSEIPIWRMFSLLDVAIVLDNLISNSKKAGAQNILIYFKQSANSLTMDFSDDGMGVDSDLLIANSLFEEGVTTRRGGAGIGLHTILYTLENRLNGSIEFVGNGINHMKGATFRINFNG